MYLTGLNYAFVCLITFGMFPKFILQENAAHRKAQRKLAENVVTLVHGGNRKVLKST